jgi:hypothetical protein
MGLAQSILLRCFIAVVIVIVGVTSDYIFRRIVPIPSIGMASIPVVTSVCVGGPVTAKAYEDEFTVIKRPENTECVARAPCITNGTTTIRPGYPVEYPAGRIIIPMVVIKAPAPELMVIMSTLLSKTTVTTEN